jgi:hypothetical protein
MQLPEITITSQSLLKTGFRNANQVEVLLEVSSIGYGLDDAILDDFIVRKQENVRGLRDTTVGKWLLRISQIRNRVPSSISALKMERLHSGRCAVIKSQLIEKVEGEQRVDVPQLSSIN